MRTAAFTFALAALLVSCEAQAPRPGPPARALTFSVIRAGASDSCVEPPHLALARTEDDWIDVFDIETDCSGAEDVTLPDVDLSSGFVVAGWLRRARCDGEAITVSGVRLAGEELEVTARSEARPSPCRPVEQVVEAFVQVDGGDAIAGAAAVSITLDGQRSASLALR